MVAVMDSSLRWRLAQHRVWTASGGRRGVRLSALDLDFRSECAERPDGKDFADAEIPGANFEAAPLVGADFAGANLAAANFARADLTSASLCKANLDYANLRGANLRHANLRRATLFEADLTGAILDGADFRGAYFKGAKLEETSQLGMVGDAAPPLSAQSADPKRPSETESAAE